MHGHMNVKLPPLIFWFNALWLVYFHLFKSNYYENIIFSFKILFKLRPLFSGIQPGRKIRPWSTVSRLLYTCLPVRWPSWITCTWVWCLKYVTLYVTQLSKYTQTALQKLELHHPVKKFLLFYGTFKGIRRFITVFKSYICNHLTLRLLMSYIYIWSTYSWCF